MEEFSFRRDYKRIIWPATIKLNFIRAAISGVVWAIFSVVMAMSESHGGGGGQIFGTMLLMIIVWPFSYLIGGIPIGLICSWLSERGVPFIGWFAFILAIGVVVADPFMYFIHRKNRELVPVENYGIFNFRLVIFVLS